MAPVEPAARAAEARAAAKVRCELVEGGTVLRLVLDDPKGNVLSMAMMDELEAALAAHRDDRTLRMVLLRGAGGSFSYGASVAEHVEALAPAMLARFHRLVRAVAAFPVPVAALVEGRCLGGAFELVLACHVVFATDGARFACPEIKLGVFPPVLAVLGAARLGAPLAERLLLTGDELDARRAHTVGFVTEVIPEDGDSEGRVLAFYRAKLRPLSAFSLRQATATIREGSGLLASLGAPLDAAEKRYLGPLLASHDGNEGIEAFLAKREPVWNDA